MRTVCMSDCAYMEIQFIVPAPDDADLKRVVWVMIQFVQWPPALQPSTPIRVSSTSPCAMRWSTPVMMSSYPFLK